MPLPHSHFTPPDNFNSYQFEALCRHAISRLTKIPTDQIHAGFLPGSSRSAAKTRHQIDLHWTVSDGICNLLCFANAKWRRNNSPVVLHELLTLIAVQHDIAAQKAMMITNSHFSTGVITHAQEKAVALLIIRPTFPPTSLPTTSPLRILHHIEDRAATQPFQPLFTHEIIHRAAFNLHHTAITTPNSPTPSDSTLSIQNPAFTPPPPPPPQFRNPHSEIRNPSSPPIPNKMIPSPSRFNIRTK